MLENWDLPPPFKVKAEAFEHGIHEGFQRPQSFAFGDSSEQLGVEVGSVQPDSSFTEDLGADSLDAVELIMAIEEAFDIEIPDEEAETMTTPAECVAAIKAKL